MIFARFAVAGLLLLTLGACSNVPKLVNEYKIDVQQGNVLTQEQVAQLRPGLTREQVRFILGTPILVDMFHSDRWDYLYRLQRGSTGRSETRRFAVFFDSEDRLYRVSGDVVAAQSGDEIVPDEKSRVLDFGEAPNAKAGPEEKGFFRRMMEKVGF